MFIRYFCHVGGESSLATLGWNYFSALYKTGIPMRVIPVNPADVSGVLWNDYAAELTRPVPKEYINIICGNDEELVWLFTIGVKNVAITQGVSDEKARAALKDYDAVICPTETTPDSTKLAQLLRGL